ncbi:MAG TPA: serine/threonine-protein kinase [Vicinamibacterales bacterium]|nr:serine/threonine-protein kinase [Vicinamibacterales bacterium]
MSTDESLTSCPQCGKKFPSTVRMCPDDGSVLEHAMTTPSHAGQVLDGKYRLDALLAEGGMGAVYRATHVMLGKTVAIKLIRPEIVASPEIVRRFQREARAATALNHPNIVSVYDLGQTPDGTLYIAMEYIDGPSLKSLMQAGRPIPLSRTISILRQVASALATAHRHNIVHRDLKPHNIMLATGPDGSELAKLVDFGIAKTFDESTQLTSAGSALGTPYYMSPEQIEGRTVDARSDVYALGIILYEMLVGEVPFADQSTPAVLVKQLKERPVRPSLRNAAVPAALEEIALRCLEKDPAQRFQTADEFAAALNSASAALSATAADVTLPMGRAAAASVPPVDAPMAGATVESSSIVASQPAADAIAASAAGTPPVVAVKTGSDTKPTVDQPAISTSPTPVSPPAQSSGSIAPLLAIAAVLLLLAGGYLWWSGRQATATPTAATIPPPADAPQTTPASAQAQPPPSTEASKPGEPPAAPPSPSPQTTAVSPAASPSAVAANQPAATAAATTERQAARNTPPANIATATRAATAEATDAPRRASAPPASSVDAPSQRTVTPAPTRETRPSAQPLAAPAIPENAAVVFSCGGAPDVCASLRAAVDDALEKAGFRVVTSPNRADVAIGAIADVLDEKAARQFGQTFNTRTYQIELTGEAPKFGDSVPMPPPATVSFDATVGRERLEEKSRLVASDIVDRVRAYVKKKRGA